MLYETIRGVDGVERNLRGYKYDANGNMVAKSDRFTVSGDVVQLDPAGEDWQYEYNVQNRLVRVCKNGEVVAEYGYDVDGTRVVVESQEKLTRYVYSYIGNVLHDEDVSTTQRYIYAFGRILVKMVGDVVADAEVSYYHHDNLGSTMMMTDENGAEVFRQDYAPFGQSLYMSGADAKLQQLAQDGFKYTGQHDDVDTGLYYYKAQYYDPEIGRFTREDEYQGDLNRPQTINVYVLNNPLRYVDPSGHTITEFLEYIIGSNFTRNDVNWESVDSLMSNVDTGDETIKYGQASLLYLGYDLGTFGPNHNGVDGKGGTKTQNAILDFQSVGLEPTGVLDEYTKSALFVAVTWGVDKESIEFIVNQLGHSMVKDEIDSNTVPSQNTKGLGERVLKGAVEGTADALIGKFIIDKLKVVTYSSGWLENNKFGVGFRCSIATPHVGRKILKNINKLAGPIAIGSLVYDCSQDWKTYEGNDRFGAMAITGLGTGATIAIGAVIGATSASALVIAGGGVIGGVIVGYGVDYIKNELFGK